MRGGARSCEGESWESCPKKSSCPAPGQVSGKQGTEQILTLHTATLQYLLGYMVAWTARLCH